MKYCTRCVMPSTRPGISFDHNGICSGCQAAEKKKTVDWAFRWSELESLCNKHRGRNQYGHDCLIAVSGGKDSHYQTWLLKEKLGMNPLLVSVEDNFPMTEAGKHNLKNLSETFGCDILSLKPNILAQKTIMRKTFEDFGKPTWYIDRLIYTYPVHIANRFRIPLLVYGENVSFEYGGVDATETPSARNQIANGVASDLPLEDFHACGVSMKDLSLLVPPTPEELDSFGFEPTYLSYFVEWNSFRNYHTATKLGFHDLTHEWDRTHHVENFDQVDSRAYLVHSWMKYPKFGHASATDYASRMVRYGLISREEAIQLVREHDHRLDPLCIRDFCSFLGYTERRFWEIVDRFYNPDLFHRDHFGNWVLKDPPWKTR